MILISEKYFNKIYWSVCALVFLIVALRAFFVPFAPDEATTFFFYVQSDNYLPYKAHVYTNNHVLNSALTNICWHLFGSHPFVLRLPNVFSFLMLCFGVFRFFRHFNTVSSKIILLSFFILTLNFLDFFELCRGYGISLAAMILGLSYLTDYFKTKTFKYILFFSICWQLALAANLILVVVLTMLLFYLFVFQGYNKVFFSVKNLILQFFNLFLLAFWIKFSFFYREKNVLDSGAGEDYWQVTFKSLIAWIYGAENLWLQLLVLTGFCLIVTFALLKFFKSEKNINVFFLPTVFYALMLVSLIIVFYLQKKILNVNFPEDRTGLFFYVFFALSLAFAINEFPKLISISALVFIPLASIFYFVTNLNFSNFSSAFYFTMPETFYDTLKSEYDKTGKIFTIGGHRMREVNFSFWNYRGGAILNHINDGEQMTMNCDYYYAMKCEEPYYKFFYDEIAYEEKWEHVLLKRKDEIKRKIVASAPTNNYNGKDEFFEFLRITDTLFANKNCLEAELEIKFNTVPKPFNAFLVFGVENTENEIGYYKRIPLNMLADNLNGKTKMFKLVTGKMSLDFKTAAVYLWNIDRKDCDFTLKTLNVAELHAKGINFVIPENFYPLIESITKKPHL
ncbi:MAG: hypothetical protein KF900_10200 [Bacteroidetes bacterium]|nr:hypothetical protein [Bacteroidota bacterium]